MVSLFGEYQNHIALSVLRSEPMTVRRIAEQRAESIWHNEADTHGKLIARTPVAPRLTAADGIQCPTQLSDDELLAIVGRRSRKIGLGSTLSCGDQRESLPVVRTYKVARQNRGGPATELARLTEVDALSLLYDRYHQMLYALAYRMVMDIQIAEDLLQETFIAVWRRAGSYSVQCGSVRTWLFSIIHHRTIDYLRQSQRYTAVNTLSFDELEHSDALVCMDAWEETWRTIQGSHVRQALASLPVAQRNVIELAYFQGWTHHEIAQECHLPLGTVKARMRLGLAHLRRLLAERGIYER
jgi:RNA polymerase sigma factor, sigma-70 family